MKFTSLAQAQAAFDALEVTHAATGEQLTAAQNQAQTNHTATVAAIAERDALRVERDSLNAAVTGHLATIADRDQKITGLTAQAQYTTDKVNAEAVRLIAASGHAPLNSGPGSSNEAKSLNRAEFSALNPHAQAQHCRAGGVITD